MTAIERYKQLYSEPGDPDGIIIKNGAVVVPFWLLLFLIHKSGIKSKKRRILKKVLKRQLNAAIKDHLKNEARKTQV